MSILDIHKCECKKVKDIIENGNNLDRMSLSVSQIIGDIDHFEHHEKYKKYLKKCFEDGYIPTEFEFRVALYRTFMMDNKTFESRFDIVKLFINKKFNYELDPLTINIISWYKEDIPTMKVYLEENGF